MKVSCEQNTTKSPSSRCATFKSTELVYYRKMFHFIIIFLMRTNKLPIFTLTTAIKQMVSSRRTRVNKLMVCLELGPWQEKFARGTDLRSVLFV